MYCIVSGAGLLSKSPALTAKFVKMYKYFYEKGVELCNIQEKKFKNCKKENRTAAECDYAARGGDSMGGFAVYCGGGRC